MYWDLQLPENIRVGVSNNRARTAMPRIAGRRVVDSIVNIGADVLAGAGTNVFVAASGTYILTAPSRWGLRLECTNNPIRDRVFRNTRDTLRAYRDAGVWPIAATIPDRVVDDFPVKMTAEEQRLYCEVQEYIKTKYDQAAQVASGQAKNALGFILTVYRRRLTSSFYAIEQSLRRRIDALDRNLGIKALLSSDDTDRLRTRITRCRHDRRASRAGSVARRASSW